MYITINHPCMYIKIVLNFYKTIYQTPLIEKRQTIQWPKDRQFKAKRQTIQWPKEKQFNGQKTDNSMAKRQTIQWPKDRQFNGQMTDNSMAKRKRTK